MRKIISLTLAIILCLSLAFATMISASAAVVGEWDVYTGRGQYKEKDNPEMKSIPGYEYTDEGLHMIPADWSTSSPWGIFQTKEQVDLRQGVYMEVRVDNFTYEGDKWFGFNIWEEKIDEFPYEEDKQSLGIEMLIRVNEDKTIKSMQVNRHTAVGDSTVTTGISTSSVINNIDAQGRPTMTLEITWSEAAGYNVKINGAMLSASDAAEMTKFFDGPDNDGMAYVSFSLQNSIKGGTAECTITKFGKSKDDWSVPAGDDGARPINNTINIAEIESADKIPLGSPAVRIDGNTLTSDLLTKPKSANNSKILIDENFLINVSTTSSWASISMSVAHETSYDVKDFPIVLIITRNLCTCNLTEEEPFCACGEMLSLLAMTGDVISESDDYNKVANCMNWSTDDDADGNSYSYFISDWTGYEGRINGIRIDVRQVKYTEEGRNSFDICEIGFFRTAQEAEAYYKYYLVDRGVLEEEEEPETDPETEIDTEADTDPSVDQTEPEESETVVDDTDVDSDDAVSDETEESEEITDNDNEQEKATEEGNDDSGANASSGCGSSIGALSILTVCTACAVCFVFKNKRDK